MDRYETFKTAYDLLREGQPLSADLRQQCEAHGLRVDELERQVASLVTAVGEDDLE